MITEIENSLIERWEKTGCRPKALLLKPEDFQAMIEDVQSRMPYKLIPMGSSAVAYTFEVGTVILLNQKYVTTWPPG